MKHILSLALLLCITLAQANTKFDTRSFPLKDFTDIDVSNVVKVVYTQGNTYSVQLTGRADWLDDMEVNTKGSKLIVKSRNSKKFNNVKKKDQPDGHHNFILRMTAPALHNIHIRGVSSFETKCLANDNISIHLSGVSKLHADNIDTDNLKLEISGVSKVSAASIRCKEMETSISGSSKIELDDMIATQSTFNISGASKARLSKLHQAETSTFKVSGASNLHLAAATSGLLSINLSGASKGELTHKGGSLRTACSGASKLEAKVECQSIHATCDGASKTSFSGTADKVEIDRGGVATNIDTSHLNQF